MTISNPILDKLSVSIPEINPEIFLDRERARFFVGVAATGNIIENPELHWAALKLRANVYVDEMHFLPESHLDEYGLEVDEDDKRSVHFTVTEQARDGESARVIATSRLIAKRNQNDLLPIERHFPEIFDNEAAPSGSVEVSRFISRHEDKFTQHKVALSLIRAMTHYLVNNQISTTYFVIEEPLWEVLRTIGLPMVKIAEPKTIADYDDTVNMAVSINPQEIVDAVTKDITGTLLLTQFFKDEDSNSGLGYYKGSLVGGGNV